MKHIKNTKWNDKICNFLETPMSLFDNIGVFVTSPPDTPFQVTRIRPSVPFAPNPSEEDGLFLRVLLRAEWNIRGRTY